MECWYQIVFDVNGKYISVSSVVAVFMVVCVPVRRKVKKLNVLVVISLEEHCCVHGMVQFRCCDPEHISRYLLVHLTLYGTFMKRGYMCIALNADDEAFPVQMKSS